MHISGFWKGTDPVTPLHFFFWLFDELPENNFSFYLFLLFAYAYLNSENK